MRLKLWASFKSFRAVFEIKLAWGILQKPGKPARELRFQALHESKDLTLKNDSLTTTTTTPLVLWDPRFPDQYYLYSCLYSFRTRSKFNPNNIFVFSCIRSMHISPTKIDFYFIQKIVSIPLKSVFKLLNTVSQANIISMVSYRKH